MKRVVLVHWNVGAAEAKAKVLRAAGYDVAVFSDQRANPRGLCDGPPDAFLIDLGRTPSHGRELAGWLRRQKATRHVPIVFIEGDPDKTERVRAFLPDATFTTWDAVVEVLPAVIARPPKDPIVPGAMDAYAGTSLPKKLGIMKGPLVALIGAPEGFEEELTDLPADVRLVRDLDGAPNVVLLFVRSQAEFEAAFPDAAKRLAKGGKLWICWPKKASGVESDLTQKVVRAFGLARQFVDYKISSIDETWSGLCFARRKAE
jgi:CheY-like chemotaxis protein